MGLVEGKPLIIQEKNDPHRHHVKFVSFNCAAAICFSMDLSQKLIRSSEIHREQPYRV